MGLLSWLQGERATFHAPARDESDLALSRWKKEKHLTCDGCGESYLLDNGSTVVLIESRVLKATAEVYEGMFPEQLPSDDQQLFNMCEVFWQRPLWLHPDSVIHSSAGLSRSAAALLPWSEKEEHDRSWQCAACKHINMYPWCSAYQEAQQPKGFEFIELPSRGLTTESTAREDEGKRTGESTEINEAALRGVPSPLREACLNFLKGGFPKWEKRFTLEYDCHLGWKWRSFMTKRRGWGRWMYVTNSNDNQGAMYFILAYF